MSADTRRRDRRKRERAGRAAHRDSAAGAEQRGDLGVYGILALIWLAATMALLVSVPVVWPSLSIAILAAFAGYAAACAALAWRGAKLGGWRKGLARGLILAVRGGSVEHARNTPAGRNAVILGGGVAVILAAAAIALFIWATSA